MNIPTPSLTQATSPLNPEETARLQTEEAFTREYLRVSRQKKFQSICPVEFRAKIDRALLRNLGAWDKADAWNGVFPGLWLWSHETGVAKTRMLWHQFRRLYVERGKAVLNITGQALAEEYFSYHMDGDPRGFYRWIKHFDIVMLDDLDKTELDDKRTPRMCRELFDQFYTNHTPVLVTSNESITYFERRLGASSARRMTAVCSEISFYPEVGRPYEE